MPFFRYISIITTCILILKLSEYFRVLFTNAVKRWVVQSEQFDCRTQGNTRKEAQIITQAYNLQGTIFVAYFMLFLRYISIITTCLLIIKLAEYCRDLFTSPVKRWGVQSEQLGRDKRLNRIKETQINKKVYWRGRESQHPRLLGQTPRSCVRHVYFIATLSASFSLLYQSLSVYEPIYPNRYRLYNRT